TFTDPGTLDTHTVVINWGDGSPNTTLNLPAGVLSFGGSAHQCKDDQPSGTSSDLYSIVVTVTDDQGGNANSTVMVRVNNVAPVLGSASITSPISPNDTAILSGSFGDQGTLDTFSLSINWGDGSPMQTTNLAAGVTSFNVPHKYTISNSNAPVSLVLQDDDTGAATTNLTVVIGGGATLPQLQMLSPWATGHVMLKL